MAVAKAKKASSKAAAPTPMAVLREAKKIILQRGFKNYTFQDIASLRSQWWAVGSERFPISLDGALELGRRAAFGHPIVPIRYIFTAPIDDAFLAVQGPKWRRWLRADSRTTEEVVTMLDAAVEHLESSPPKPVDRGIAAAKRAAQLKKCDPRLTELRIAHKHEVVKLLGMSPGQKAITLDGIEIGELRTFDHQDIIMGTPRTKKVWRAELPNVLGYRVVKEGASFMGVAEQVAIAVTGILKRHAQANSQKAA